MNIKSTKTTALQVIAVVAWLWAKPIADSLHLYGFGASIASMIKYVVCFIAGVVLATYVPSKIESKIAVPALVAGVLLIISYLFYDELYFSHIHECRWLVSVISILGIPLLGFALGATRISWKPKSFTWSFCMLIVFFAMYLGHQYSGRFIPFEMLVHGEAEAHAKVLTKVYYLIYFILQISIAIQLWRTMTMDIVIQAFEMIPKLTKCVAGLFWGMFLVIPAGRCSEFYEDVIMLLLAPVVAYVMTVLLRAIYTVIRNLVRCSRPDKSDWKRILYWWR